MDVRVSQIEKRSWVEVDLSQIRKNYRIYKTLLPKESNIIAVIKADAYGHGDVQIARLLSEEGVTHFAVSNVDEAIGLREAGIKGDILILGYSSPIYAKVIFDYDLTQTIVSEEHFKALKATLIPIKVQVAIDTGMNRIGLDVNKDKDCIRIIREADKIFPLRGVFSHLSVADSDHQNDIKFTIEQIEKFYLLCDKIEAKQIKLHCKHCLNSSGGIRYKEYLNRGDNSCLVRLGILLYGMRPSPILDTPMGINPALSWYSTVSRVKEIKKGESIGYGRSFVARNNMKIATVTIGYADGLRREFADNGSFLINGKKAKILGRICMDQTMVDVTEIPDVQMGSIVSVISNEQMDQSVDNMAKILNTINYEIVCGISKRVQRFYYNNNNFL